MFLNNIFTALILIVLTTARMEYIRPDPQVEYLIQLEMNFRVVDKSLSITNSTHSIIFTHDHLIGNTRTLYNVFSKFGEGKTWHLQQ